MRFMQTESVLQTKNRPEPAKNRFSVALLLMSPLTAYKLVTMLLHQPGPQLKLPS